MKAALIIIDLQEDFLPPNGSLAVKTGREVIPVINKLCESKKWDCIIASKDWHPPNHCSFAANHGLQPFDTKEFKHPLGEDTRRTETLWPIHCVQNTPGAQFPPEFTHEKSLNATVLKGYLPDREYYSAFGDVWGIHHTELNTLLKEAGITHCFFTGIAYDFCVYWSCIDAVKLGYTTYVIEEASRAVDPSKWDETTESLIKAGVNVISMKDEALLSVPDR